MELFFVMTLYYFSPFIFPCEAKFWDYASSQFDDSEIDFVSYTQKDWDKEAEKAAHDFIEHLVLLGALKSTVEPVEP